MTLGTFNGTGFLLSDGVELKYSSSGSAYARLPLVFKNSKKDANGNWTSDKEFKIEGTVFGPLAEFLADQVTSRQDIAVSGQLYTEEFERKDGSTGSAVRMQVASAAPLKPREKTTSSSGFASSNSDVPF